MKPLLKIKPLLNRTDERATLTVRRILLNALIYFVVTRVAAMLLIGAATVWCIGTKGFNPMAQLQFAGNPQQLAAGDGSMLMKVGMLLLFAPLVEELAFRLWLSFKRRDVAVGAGAMTLFLVSQAIRMTGLGYAWLWALPFGAAAGIWTWRRTASVDFDAMRQRWLVSAMYASAALFGLTHLFAMSGLTWGLLPFALLVCLMLFFAGAVFTYLRVNLGFGWGLLAHVVNNLAAVMILLMGGMPTV